MSEIDAYKIFRQLEERKKRENPYKFYDKDELIDEILKLEDKLQQKENITKELKEDITFCINNMKNEYSCTDSRTNRELHTMVKILEESLDKGE